MRASPLVASLVAGLVLGAGALASVEAFRPDRAMMEVGFDDSAFASTVHDLNGQVVTCDAQRPIGILASSDAMVSAATITRSCRVGVKVIDRPERPGLFVRQRSPGVISHITSRAHSFGLVVGGCCGLTLDSNIASDSDVGFLVLATRATLTNNRASDHALSGIIVTGRENLLDGNEVRRSKLGIQVTGSVALADDRGEKAKKAGAIQYTLRFLTEVTDHAANNEIRFNTVLGNGTDLLDYAEQENFNCGGSDPEHPEPINYWHDNDFETKIPACLD